MLISLDNFNFPYSATHNKKIHGARYFCRTTPLVWNSIPYDIRNSSTIVTFKRKFLSFRKNSTLSVKLSVINLNINIILT